MDKYILIVAGGKGLRFESDLPKQLVEVNGKPLLMWSFDAFKFLKKTAQFVLVLNGDLIGQWKHLCVKHNFNIPHQIVEGGPKRFHSVKNGLNLVPNSVLVAIHDAVRPLVSERTIIDCFSVAYRKGNAVPAIVVNESLRETDGPLNHPVNRDKYKVVQTPQTFHSDKIKKAYQQSYREHFTDDATVLESTGEIIHLVEGNRENIKITNNSDLLFAESILKLS